LALTFLVLWHHLLGINSLLVAEQKKWLAGSPIPANHAFHPIREEAPAAFPEKRPFEPPQSGQAAIRFVQGEKPILLLTP